MRRPPMRRPPTRCETYLGGNRQTSPQLSPLAAPTDHPADGGVQVGTLDASLQSPARGTDVGARGAAPLSARATRLIALAGLGSFALIIVAAFVAPPLWSSPAPTSSGAHVAAYLQANHGRTIASLYIYSLAMGLFLCFAAGLWSWLRQSEPAPQPLSAIFAFGAIALAVLIFAAFADRRRDELPPAAAGLRRVAHRYDLWTARAVRVSPPPCASERTPRLSCDTDASRRGPAGSPCSPWPRTS